MMKNALRALVVGLTFSVIAGCASMSQQSATFETVTIPGTGDSQDLLRELAKSYHAQYPNRQVIIPDSIDSGGGIRVVATGEAPIGRVSRELSAEEQAKYGALNYIEFARVPVAFVVGSNAGLSNLSQQQICAIFNGHTTNWQDVGGNNVPIDVQSRPGGGSNMQTIRKHIACFADLQVTSKAHFNLRNADLVNSMQSIAGAIGFMPLSESELHGFTTIMLDGVAPSDAHYTLGIGLSLVYKKAFSPSIQAFVDYLKTKPAQQIMRQTGHVPVG